MPKAVVHTGKKTSAVWNSFNKVEDLSELKYKCKSCCKIVHMNRVRVDRQTEHLKSCRIYGQGQPCSSQNVSAEEEKSSMDEDKELNAIVSNPEEKEEKEKFPREYEFAPIKDGLSSQICSHPQKLRSKNPNCHHHHHQQVQSLRILMV